MSSRLGPDFRAVPPRGVFQDVRSADRPPGGAAPRAVHVAARVLAMTVVGVAACLLAWGVVEGVARMSWGPVFSVARVSEPADRAVGDAPRPVASMPTANLEGRRLAAPLPATSGTVAFGESVMVAGLRVVVEEPVVRDGERSVVVMVRNLTGEERRPAAVLAVVSDVPGAEPVGPSICMAPGAVSWGSAPMLAPGADWETTVCFPALDGAEVGAVAVVSKDDPSTLVVFQ